jgi:hypothetical protein
VKLGPVVLFLAATLGVASPVQPAAGGCRAGSFRAVGTATTSYAAVARTAVRAYGAPGGNELARFDVLNQNGYPTTFRVVGSILGRNCRATWYRVQLPMRPNGVTGYVRPVGLVVQRLRTRIEVDLSARTLMFFRSGRRVLATRVAVGSPATPTPVGRFYVNQRFVTTNPGGPFGPAALGVSAFSPVLTGWAQGGPIGIHGTNEPWSIGRAVSNGCIRVPNATLRRLFAAARGGTPVVIHP